VKYRPATGKLVATNMSSTELARNILDIYFPKVLSNIIAMYAKFSGTLIKTNKYINVIPKEIAVHDNEIFVLDNKSILRVYDWESLISLRTFDVNPHMKESYYIDFMCATDRYIYINHGVVCSCCGTDYTQLSKYDGSLVDKFPGDSGKVTIFNEVGDKLFVYSADPTTDYDCSMYVRNLFDFKKCEGIDFNERIDDFVCDDIYMYYTHACKLYTYDLKTGLIRNIDLQSIPNSKENLFNLSVFLVDDSIIIRTKTDELYVYDKHTFEHLQTNKIDRNELIGSDYIHISAFKSKLFMWNRENGISMYELY
jgi:hypothetical protein